MVDEVRISKCTLHSDGGLVWLKKSGYASDIGVPECCTASTWTSRAPPPPPPPRPFWQVERLRAADDACSSEPPMDSSKQDGPDSVSTQYSQTPIVLVVEHSVAPRCSKCRRAKVLAFDCSLTMQGHRPPHILQHSGRGNLHGRKPSTSNNLGLGCCRRVANDSDDRAASYSHHILYYGAHHEWFNLNSALCFRFRIKD